MKENNLKHKKALIFDAYDQYEIRMKYIQKAFEMNGYETVIYQADFDHVRKQYYPVRRDCIHYVHVHSYKKNLSVQRMYSHAMFAKECARIAEQEENVEFVYAMIPPNSMSKAFGKYKQKHPGVKLWFDVLDMWPESLPVGDKVKKMGSCIFEQWRMVRDNLLSCADLVTPECDLFKNELGKKNHIKGSVETVYLCQKPQFIESNVSLGIEIHFLYCGTINNIIDIQLIGDYLQEVNKHKKVVVEIIGDGEHRQDFLDDLSNRSITYHYHGYVYDNHEKEEIYKTVHFGLNCMKDTVFVGLTMKSLDYLSHGLPIINNIPADTASFIDKYKAGVNINPHNVKECALKLSKMNDKEYQEVRKNVACFFNEKLAEDIIQKQMAEAVRKVKSG